MSKLNNDDNIEYILYNIPSSGISESESESDISSDDETDQNKT